jgi:hypothetical protein
MRSDKIDEPSHLGASLLEPRLRRHFPFPDIWKCWVTKLAAIDLIRRLHEIT